jgi:undecaprenyl diphosphate synthase
MVFLDTLFPDFDRRHLWQACEIYARRDRRYGGALDVAGGDERADAAGGGT